MNAERNSPADARIAMPVNMVGILQGGAVMALVAIPASSFFALRTLIIFALVLSLLLGRNLKKRTPFGILISFLLVFGYILFSFLQSSSSYPIFLESNLEALARYTSFFVLLTVLLLCYEMGSMNLKVLFFSLLAGTLFFNLAKIALTLTVPLGFLSARGLTELVEGLGIVVVDGFWSEDSLFNRLVFGNDILGPFVLLFVLIINKKYKFLAGKFELFYTLISATAAFLTFTRYIWLVEALVLFYHYGVVKKKGALLLASGVTIFIAAWYLYLSVPELFDVFFIRLFDSPSLDIKAIQADALLKSFGEYPILGCGLGCYSKHFIRSEYLSFVYEVQIYAFLMQFGIIGSILMSTYLVWIVKGRRFEWKKRKGVYFFYALWIVSGFSNPYLFILTSTFCYFLFYVLVNESSMDDPNRSVVR